MLAQSDVTPQGGTMCNLKVGVKFMEVRTGADFVESEQEEVN
jgi:hypothetical protein